MRISRNYTFLVAVALLCVPLAAHGTGLESAQRAYDKGDYNAALRELRPLAETGNARAQTMLGLMYNLGQGLPRDLGQAAKWYRAAADQGNAEAEFHLGTIYLNGSGVTRDGARGLKLLQDAAGQGVPEASLILGMAYMNLKDVPRDVVQADMWLRVAEAQGESFARGQRAKLESHMTKVQISKAQSLAADWKQKVPSR